MEGTEMRRAVSNMLSAVSGLDGVTREPSFSYMTVIASRCLATSLLVIWYGTSFLSSTSFPPQSNPDGPRKEKTTWTKHLYNGDEHVYSSTTRSSS